MALDKVRRKEVLGREEKAAQALGNESLGRTAYYSIEEPRCVSHESNNERWRWDRVLLETEILNLWLQ